MATAAAGTPLPTGVSIWNAEKLTKASSDIQAALDGLLNDFGVLSAASQGIRQPMTSSAKFRSSDHRLYVMSDNEGTAGFLKVGSKHLYHYDRKGNVQEIDPICALDFYVLERCQRQGIGLSLLNAFLEAEGVEARMVGWDKPTDKSLGLLSKHYNLTSFIPQPNNFVIFDEHFS
jgi:alpha-tubulin N-acetyltransferase 1